MLFTHPSKLSFSFTEWLVVGCDVGRVFPSCCSKLFSQQICPFIIFNMYLCKSSLLIILVELYYVISGLVIVSLVI